MQVWENEAADIRPLRLPFLKGREQQRRSLDVQTDAERGMTGFYLKVKPSPTLPKTLGREEMGKREREGNEISFLFFNHNVLFWKRFKS